MWQTLTDLSELLASGTRSSLCCRRRPWLWVSALRLTIQPPGGRAMTFKPWVTAVEPHRYLEWLGRLAMPGIFDGRHSFTLTPMAGGRTLVQQSETFTGALVPFTGPLLARTRAGFVAMNEALGYRVGSSGENPSGSPGSGTPAAPSSR